MRNVDHPRRYHRRGQSSGRRKCEEAGKDPVLSQNTWRAGENGGMWEGERMGSHKEKELDLTSFPLQEWDVSREASLRPRSPQGWPSLLQDWMWPGLRSRPRGQPWARWVSAMLPSLIFGSLWGMPVQNHSQALPLWPHAVPSGKSERVEPWGFGGCFYMLFTNLMLASPFSVNLTYFLTVLG